jgi:hypothetical protein
MRKLMRHQTHGLEFVYAIWSAVERHYLALASDAEQDKYASLDLSEKTSVLIAHVKATTVNHEWSSLIRSLQSGKRNRKSNEAQDC